MFALTITRNAKAVDVQIVEKIEVVIYAMAEKFLNPDDKKLLREVVKMTELGQMLVNDGIEQGIEKGIEKTRMDLVKKKLLKGKTVEEIADALEESVEVLQELNAKIQSGTEE